MKKSNSVGRGAFRVFIYVFCIFLAILSLFPFVIMFINATRSTFEIQQNGISLLPSRYLASNYAVFTGKTFDPLKGHYLHRIHRFGYQLLHADGLRCGGLFLENAPGIL